MTEKIVIGVIGFLFGGLFGGFLMGCVCGREYKSTIATLQDRNEALKKELREYKSENRKAREEKAEMKEKDYDKTISSLGYSNDDVEFDDPFGDEEEKKSESETADEESEGAIRLVGKAIFEEDLDYRDTETLTFYRQDGILADAYDDPVNNQADIIGIEAIEAAESTDEDTLYVINDMEDKMYEIMIEKNESFYRDIL